MTQAALLSTKFYVPAPCPGLVPRPRLAERLGAGPARPLTLISAPAGCGKTTLVAEWRASGSGRDVALAWLSLEDDDNDPSRFLAYLVSALAGLKPGLGQTALTLLRSPQPPPPRVVLASLINDLDELSIASALVLDDLHLITSAAIHDALVFLLEHLPPCLRLIVCTRADPPWPLPRLRARNQLVELRGADLRFSRDETAAFLCSAAGVTLAAADLAALDARTEGWAAGLQLAALSLRGCADVGGFLKAFTGSHAYVVDYLAEEVLQRQPPHIQAFLRETSILERLSGPLCDALLSADDVTRPVTTGVEPASDPFVLPPSAFILDGSQSVLEYLLRSNLFLIPLDDQRHWFRYHPLFASLLKTRLLNGWPQRVPALHARASTWFEQNGLPAEAVAHALAGRDFERAAHLIEQNIIAFMIRGEMATLIHWIEALPGAIVARRPLLCINQAWVLTFAGQLDRVEPLLHCAEQALNAAPAGQPAVDSVRDQLGNIASNRAFLAGIAGDDDCAIEQALKADSLLSPSSYIARSIIPFTLGRSYRSAGQLARAVPAFEELVRIGLAAGTWTVGVAWFELAATRKLQGRLRQAEQVYYEARQWLAEHNALQFGNVAKVDAGLSDLLRERNELAAACELAHAALERMQPWGNPQDLAIGYGALVRGLEARGDLDGAEAVLSQAEQVRRDYALFPPLVSLIDNCRVRLWLAQGRLAEAEGWAGESRPGGHGSRLVRQQDLTTLARVRLAQGRQDSVGESLPEAAALLTELATAPATAEVLGRRIEILALLALARQAQGQHEVALAALDEALCLGEPEGFVRVFVDEGLQMRWLIEAFRLRFAGTDGSLALDRRLAYVDQLLRAFQAGALVTLGEAAVTGGLSQPVTAHLPARRGTLIEPLSGRELEVLRLMALGRSNPEIAQALFVAVGTVKTHVHNICGKLGAHNRVRAVVKARELGLL